GDSIRRHLTGDRRTRPGEPAAAAPADADPADRALHRAGPRHRPRDLRLGRLECDLALAGRRRDSQRRPQEYQPTTRGRERACNALNKELGDTATAVTNERNDLQKVVDGYRQQRDLLAELDSELKSYPDVRKEIREKNPTLAKALDDLPAT